MKKTAIVTGGTRGIGKAISLCLAKLDYNLVLNYREDLKQAESTCRECKKYNSDIELIQADVSKIQDVEGLMNRTIKRFNSIDVVINNAGKNIDRPIAELTEEEWNVVVDTNMKGVFLVSKFAGKVMLSQPHASQIINIASTTGIQGRKNGINYCASKAGVIVMTKCLALEFAPKIKVNCIIPGFTYTEETEKRFDLKNRLKEEVNKRDIPLGRIGMPEEIADAVAFLISDAGKYINGQKIIIDGGEYMC